MFSAALPSATNLALPLAVIVSVAIYLIGMMLLPKNMFSEQSLRVREALKRIEVEQRRLQGTHDETLEDDMEVMMRNPLVRGFTMIPHASNILPMLQSAGLATSIDKLFIGLIIVFIAVLFFTAKLGIIASLLIACISAPTLIYLYIRKRISKQHKRALEIFPEALDMIVRSVRAGYPINTAISIVAENVPAPLDEEFRRILHEVGIGTTLGEACLRFAKRLDDPDVRFFAVVIGIQQESGGNLSEILGNISHVIRQRRQLKMRIRALSSEGRATAWIIGALIVLLTITIQFMSPEHLKPLFTTPSGHTALMVIGSMMVSGVLLIRKIINVEV
jgi:tight adherence protein B